MHVKSLIFILVILINYSGNQFLNLTNLINYGNSRLLNISSWQLNLPQIPKLIDYRECRGHSDGREGLCKTRFVCDSENGISDGKCALGLGVCCITMVKCNQTFASAIASNNSYFTNSDYPNATISSQLCQITINKMSGVTQLRIDFIEFDLLGPIDGKCSLDSFKVTQTSQRVDSNALCGYNAAQHIYVNVGESSQVTLSVRTSADLYDRRWMIKITKLEENNALLAPNGCFQYFTGTTNRVKSFNLNNVYEKSKSIAMSYAFCIREERDYCNLAFTSNYFNLKAGKTVKKETLNNYRATFAHQNIDQQSRQYQHNRYSGFSRVSNRKYSIPDYLLQDIPIKHFYNPLFQASNSHRTSPSNSNSLVAESRSKANCNEKNDSLLFPPSNSENRVQCGDSFNREKPLIVRSSPYVVYVSFRASDNSAIGFHLSYEQLLCQS